MTDTFVVSYKLNNRNRSQQAPLEESQIVFSTPIIDKLLTDWFFSITPVVFLKRISEI